MHQHIIFKMKLFCEKCNNVIGNMNLNDFDI